MFSAKNKIVFQIVLTLMTFLVEGLESAETNSLPPREHGELLIKMKQQPSGTNGHAIPAVINSLNRNIGVKTMEKVFSPIDRMSSRRSSVAAQENSKSQELSRWYSVKIDKEQDIDKIARSYSDSPAVECVEPLYVYSIASTPNDPYFSGSGSWGQLYDDQWGLKMMEAEKAWNISVGNGHTVIAVIDTGADYNHPDLKNNVWNNSDEIASNGVDDDNNGYVDDVVGWDFSDDTNTPLDKNGHGTHISGIISAVGNNGLGISGVCWQAKVMVLKGLTDNGGGISKQLAKAIQYAVDNGARVINISWGGFGNSAVIQDALDYAVAHDCIIVAAAGNNNSDAGRFFPGNYERAITVTACDANDKRASFANYGSAVDVTAPGVDILSLRAEGTDMYQKETHIIGTNYYRASGTSMATPFVSGLAALIVSQNSLLSAQEVANTIYSSCEDLGQEGKDDYFGYGKINAAKAMMLNGGAPVKVTDVTVFDTPSDDGNSITAQWSFPQEAGLKGFSIYYSELPFSSITDDGVRVSAQSPVNDPTATTCEITGLEEGHGYYLAVIASITAAEELGTKSNYSSAQPSLLSSEKPVYPIHNIIKNSASGDAIAYGSDYQIKAIIPQNGENENKILNITRPEDGKESQIALAETRVDGGQEDELSDRIVQFSSVGTLVGKVGIQLSYPENIYGWQESNLKAFYLVEETATWEEVPGVQIVRRDENVVYTEIDGNELSRGMVFRLVSKAGALENLDQVAVHPNPYKPNSGLGHTKISFTNMLPSSAVKIYTVTGELVRDLSDVRGIGEVNWDVTNEDGEKIASGIYVYLVENENGSRKIGKLAVIK